MTEQQPARLVGRIASVEKAEAIVTALDAAEALRDLNPHFTEGPGRKLGL
jgi:hypothetical protein